MKSIITMTTTITITILALFAVSVCAEYGGTIWAHDYCDCPKQKGYEPHYLFRYPRLEGGSCYDLKPICPEGICTISMSGYTVHGGDEPPRVIGACKGANCTNCRYKDVENPIRAGWNDWSVHCLRLWYEPWMSLLE